MAGISTRGETRKGRYVYEVIQLHQGSRTPECLRAFRTRGQFGLWTDNRHGGGSQTEGRCHQAELQCVLSRRRTFSASRQPNGPRKSKSARMAKFAITVYPGGSLTKADKVYEGVENGISDIGMSCFAYTRGRFPLLEGLDLPLGYPNGSAATKICDEMVRKYAPGEIKDVKMLYVHAHGLGILASKKAVKSLDDMKGLKVRATGLSTKIVQKLGGNPIGMEPARALTRRCRRRGRRDAVPDRNIEGLEAGRSDQLGDRQPGIGYTTAMFVAMNLKVWEKLPADVQKVIEEVSKEFVETHGQAWDKADADGKKFVEGLKKEFIPLSKEEQAKWIEAVKPVLDEYVKAMKEKNLPGDALLKDLQDAIGKIEKK